MMQNVEHVTQSTRLMLRHGLMKEFLVQSGQKVFGAHVYVDAVLDVGAFKPVLRYPVPLHVRAVTAPEDPSLYAVVSDRTLGSAERHEASRRMAMLATGIRTCYASVDDAGNVRVMQWLIPAGENEAMRHLYGDWFPWLAADEALMENAYVFPKYRGTGVLSVALSKLVEIARGAGVARIRTGIPGTNVNSLMSFSRMGFRPERVRVEKRRFGVAARSVVAVTSCNDLRSFAGFVAGPALLSGRVPDSIAF